MEKFNAVIFGAAIVFMFMLIQAGMITCDIYEYIREKVKGPRTFVK